MLRGSFDRQANAKYDKIHGPARVIRRSKKRSRPIGFDRLLRIPPGCSTSHPAVVAAIRAMGFDSYSRYLESNHWYGFRRIVLERTPDCAACGQVASVVHHMTYERIGSEAFSDVKAMCPRCHDLLHTFHRRKGIPLTSFQEVAEMVRKAIANEPKPKR